MKTFLTLMGLLLSLNLFAAQFIELDSAKSKIGFEIIKFKIGSPVEGKFDSFYGHGQYDPKTKTLEEVEAIVFVPSINTEQAKRDRHLRTKDFFNAAEKPTIRFKSSQKAKVNGEFKLKGKFTMRGVTKDVTLNMKTVKVDGDKIHISGATTINRLDYGVSWNHAMEKSDWKTVLGILGKTVLDDKVKIKLDLVANIIE